MNFWGCSSVGECCFQVLRALAQLRRGRAGCGTRTRETEEVTSPTAAAGCPLGLLKGQDTLFLCKPQANSVPKAFSIRNMFRWKETLGRISPYFPCKVRVGLHWYSFLAVSGIEWSALQMHCNHTISLTRSSLPNWITSIYSWGQNQIAGHFAKELVCALTNISALSVKSWELLSSGGDMKTKCHVWFWTGSFCYKGLDWSTQRYLNIALYFKK